MLENDKNIENKESIFKEKFSAIERLVLSMVNKVDREFFSFILGFVSSLVFENLYGMFNSPVTDGYLFLFQCISSAFIVAVCILMFSFNLQFINFQKKISTNNITDTARKNYIIRNLDSSKKIVVSLSVKFALIIIFILLDLITIILKFIYLNNTIDASVFAT